MSLKRVFLAVLLVAVLVLSWLGYITWFTDSNPSSQIQLSGNIEVDDIAVSFKIPGEVIQRPVSEGERVRAGQVIARLDDTEWQQEVQLRRAEVDARRAELDELISGPREEEIKRAEAALRRAETTLGQRRRDLQRAEHLHERDLISEQDYEMVVTDHATTQQDVQVKRQTLRELIRGPREERIRKARAQLKRARHQLEQAETKLGYTTLRSPISGVVLAEHVDAGEHVAAGIPVVTIANLRNVWLRAFVEEEDLGRVHLGMPVTIRTDSYPDKTYQGRVGFISDAAEFTPKNIETREVRTRLVYRTKIPVRNPNRELKPGMPAVAVLQLESDTDSRH